MARIPSAFRLASTCLTGYRAKVRKHGGQQAPSFEMALKT